MKTLMFKLLLILVIPATVWASFESVRIKVIGEPQIPAKIRLTGMLEGRVVVGLSIGKDGGLHDALVLAATHQELVRPCLDAIANWHFQPARLDGEPVSVSLEVEINFSQSGAVISRTGAEMVREFMDRLGGRRPDYEVCPPDELDRPLVPIRQVQPLYGVEDLQQGLVGKIRVSFYVDESGNVRLPSVTADTHPVLSSIAVEALRNWKFSPPTRAGKPVIIAASQEFNFGGER